jgi:hypothetical protein
MDKDTVFATTFDGAVFQQGRNYTVNKLHKLLKFCFSESIYLPLNLNDKHWILVVIHWSRYLVEIYDSWYHKNIDVCATFLTLLRRVQKDVNNSCWQAHNHYRDNTVYRQINSYSFAFLFAGMHTS